MINVIFNDFNYEILPKKLETFDKYCKVLQWGRQHPTRFAEQFMNLQFTDMQKWVFLSSWVPSNIVWLLSRSSGKALNLHTKVCPVVHDRKSRNGVEKREPKTIGELQVGDLIYDETGNPTTVLHLNPIILEDEYKVYFEDGEVISCNGEHLWCVYDLQKEKNKRKEEQKTTIVSTEEIYGNVFKESGTSHRFAVPLTKPIKYKEQDLIIEPYLFGCFIGDGRKNRPTITCDEQDLEEELAILNAINKNGWIFESKKNKNRSYDIIIRHPNDILDKNGDVCISEFCKRLRELGVFDNKHIPDVYKYGNVQQRLEIIQGIFDCDGSTQERGRQVFVQKDKRIYNDVKEVVGSLGIKYTETSRRSQDKRTGKTYYANVLYTLASFEVPVFKLKRKYEKQKNLKYPGTRKSIIKVEKTGKKVPMRCITVSNQSGLFLCGEHYTVTHNSYMAAIFLMIRALLFPHTNSYILAPSGSQAQETFTKMENIAKNNIASAVGVTRVFLDETVKYNSKADPFTHNAQSYTVSLYNGSTINTLNSVAKNIVGIRSNFSVYDEAGKIERDFYALTQPFTAQDTNFITGYGINTEIYPIQLPNKTLYLSSAEGIDSELFDQYKLCFNKMLLGDPNYFVADIDYHFSIHPYMNGKPQKPQLNEDVVRNAFETNPYKARREYENIFDRDGGEDVFVKRSTINKYSQPYYPVYQNDGTKKYLIAYDPATKLDNSIVTIAELFRDEERGLMVKFVNCVNLVEILSNGEKAVMQKPKQIERIKDLIVDYNLGALDFENIVEFSIDAGAGGSVSRPQCEEIYIKITL